MSKTVTGLVLVVVGVSIWIYGLAVDSTDLLVSSVVLTAVAGLLLSWDVHE